ncbi:hypothetical protein J2W28_001696 [Variovorax boronicumulans]|uniref:glycosyltransferase family 2 protein n=1 Tax=Variovorax boronicumulans TaxID=436515 RepID=UPI002787E2BC|nr:glycosyltransferase family 2 protein [Variovorax boronicumulans]MDP9995608.1 hypothetical protein [Variovorax boronicumulans]MDQ0002556.1 hypothetical protein [Variovorax boronicumulans]
MRTVICHFFNEEYMLPWWLRHHLSLFDHGVLIDHGSTDNSVEICRTLAPEWRVVRSRLTHFDAFLTDLEVMNYENELPGWKIALNVTEFLMSSSPLAEVERFLLDSGKKGCGASGMLMVDPNPGSQPDPDKPLPLQQHFGIDDNAIADPADRAALAMSHAPQRNRFYHRLQVGMYQPGRHHSYHPDAATRLFDLMIFHYGYAPWNDQMKQRKMQIAGKILPEHLINQWGGQHFRKSAELDQDHARISAGAVDLRGHSYAGPALDLCCRY